MTNTSAPLPVGQLTELVTATAQKLGFTARPKQVEAAVSLLSGRDTLLISPTGSGKSLVPQTYMLLRGTAHDGITVVVAPLIALAADQHRRALELGLRAALWNSDVSDADKRAILHGLETGAYDCLFTTAESLAGPVLAPVLRGKVSLAWVDESDCAVNAKTFRASWGRVGKILDSIEPAVRFACTATLPKGQEAELIDRCGLSSPLVLRMAPNRPNLSFEKINRTVGAVSRVLRRLKNGRALVFCATVRAVKDLAGKLQADGLDVRCFHGQLPPAQRRQVLSDFGASKFPVLVCSDAAGRGVDWPDIRQVILWDPSADIPAFAQAFGRAGRDGKPSTIYLCSENARSGWFDRRFLVLSAYPELSAIRAVWDCLSEAGPEGLRASQGEIADRAGIRGGKYIAASVFNWLRRNGLLWAREDKRDARRNVYGAKGDFDAVSWAELEQDRQAAERGLEELSELWALDPELIAGEIERHFES